MVSLYLELSTSPLFITAYFLNSGRSCSTLKLTATASSINRHQSCFTSHWTSLAATEHWQEIADLWLTIHRGLCLRELNALQYCSKDQQQRRKAESPFLLCHLLSEQVAGQSLSHPQPVFR